MSTSVLTSANINQKIRATQYAVRGALLIKAEDLQHRLKSGDKSLPFKEIIFCNIGNPQELKQKPITFFRQVISLVENPELLERPEVNQLYPKDAIERAKFLTSQFASTGAYSHSKGLPIIRKFVADFIQRRDGYPANPEDIFLTDGASPAVQRVLQMLISSKEDGIMIPIPQYPLYSATITLLGGSQVGYFLDEKKNWSLSVEELQRSLDEAKSKGISPRALVVINPGNPTGQCMEEENMKDVVKFCKRNNLLLMADEVYQENSYISSKPFVSFKKVVCSLGKEFENFEVASFHSTSKGFIGECGKRGGYMELYNFDEEVKAEFYKMASVNLCPNVIGQIMMGEMVNPPKEGEPSFNQYKSEKEAILKSLKSRAIKLTTALNTLEGVTCNEAEGAMYAFPQIHLPAKAIAAAKAAGQAPDALYCFELLENTGICVVPGSGFGQVDGTWHFRTTFLPGEEKIDLVIELLASFHKKFMDKYRD